jgi:mono/diheme cytochrome c family protein
MKSGSAVYADQCAACHASDGSGVEGLFPMLKGSSLVQSIDPSSVLHVVLRGARTAATDPAPTGPAMPSFGWTLTDFEVAAVATCVRNAWGNRASPVDTATVTKTRQALEQRTLVLAASARLRCFSTGMRRVDCRGSRDEQWD